MSFDVAGYTSNQAEKPLIGIVVNNQDPLLLRRVQCKIEGFLETDDDNEEALPWFRPKTSGLGGRSDYGNFDAVPELNTAVLIELPGGDVYNGVYSALPDTAVDSSQKRLFSEDYPNTYGTCDSKGNVRRVNKKKGYEENYHHSGVFTKIDKDGNVHLFIPNNLIIHVGGNCIMQVNKEMFIRALGSLGLKSEKELGLAGNWIENRAVEAFAIDSPYTDINDGNHFGVRDALDATVPVAITMADAQQQKMVELMKKVKESGELAEESIQAQRKAISGTRDS